MTIPSHSAPVPPFHSLEGGTMEQTLHQRNSSWNVGGTSSLKALANKVLEQNKKGNKLGTAPSKSVPSLPQSFPACGTSAEVDCRVELDNFLYEYNERAAIAEYDGQQTLAQAERIAYLDAFVAVLVALPHEDTEGDWLSDKIAEGKKWLLDQGMAQPK